METGILRLHESISDRLEAEAPLCTVHSSVAFRSFLVAETKADGSDRLVDLTADLLVADGKGSPLVAVLREDKLHPSRHVLRVDTLMDASMPFVEMREQTTHSDIWDEISAHLPRP
jgi:hypothetical protein